MSTFADSSALVKIYADEPGHEDVRELPALVVSQLARVEVPAALWRKYRLRELTPRQVSVLVAEFEADFYGTLDEPGRFAVIPISDLVLETASRLTRVHGLRGYDATQLACAMLAVSADRDCRTFAATDKSLRAAAVGEGFTVVP
ncbi:type II toxin-antitoxin system VapC family toxin [Amycolatopsis sp. GM8]|uniref:type II toxin-antitoxin system VapC family toxin n=1 Tax=Amycolatopsis sp. GM8 TaxID=2896530 RepID=UPI001F3E32F1|nr:type II toxin-antitoxin system VapC family toxin [Amycolatopsis sp. GM8]